jgi:cobalt-zinc-cadmium efflux system outer membrane protein
MTGRKMSCALLAPFLLVAAHAHGSELTLERAVELARTNAPQLQAQAAAMESAEAIAVAAGRLPDPSLVVGIDNLPVTSDDAWSISRDFMTMRKIGVMQDFPNARKRSAQRASAQAAVSVVRSETAQADLDIARAAAEAWVEVYATDQLEKNLRALRPELELQAKAVTAALGSARASSADALTAQAAILDLDDRLLEAHRAQRAARITLGRWIGDEPSTASLSSAPSFDQLPVARNTVLTTLHQHASVLAFQAQLALAQTQIDLATAEKHPDWSAELAYAKRGDAFSDMVSLEFKVGLPIFSRNRQDPAIAAKRAEYRRLESLRDAELRMHTEEVASTLAAWQSAHDRSELFRTERLPLARQRAQAALAGYRSGNSGLMDVLGSIVAEAELNQTYSELLRELGRAWVFLRYLQPQEGSL